MKSQILAIVLIALLIVAASFTFSHGSSASNPKYVSVAILLYDGDYSEQLFSFLKDTDFHNYTFILGSGAFEYYLANSSHLSFMQSYGELIPYFGYLQSSPTQTRFDIVNSTLQEWHRYLGSYPKGVMMFQPDTYTLNTLKSFGVEYSYGYCPDQYQIDYMTMRGGSPMPYYADSLNALMPNRLDNGGIVVLPWLLWDWVDGYTVNHRFCNHPLDNARRNNDLYGYVANLTDRTLTGSSPFGYVSYSFEWDWLSSENSTTDAKIILENMLSHSDYKFAKAGDFVDWFKQNYPVMPNYDVKFVSPNSGQKVEWFINRAGRVVRVGTDEVCSYVNYSNQPNDKFLNENKSINLNQDWNATNSIDNSLHFTVDCLGGGVLRAPVVGQPVRYDGTLANFPKYQSSSSFSFSLEFWIGISLLALCVVVSIAFIKSARKRKNKKNLTS